MSADFDLHDQPENREKPRMSVLMAPDIEDMLAQKRTHEARTALEELYAAEVADLLAELKPTSRAVVFRLLPREKAADVFTFLPSDQQNQLLDELTNEQLVQMFNEMDPDDRAELFDEMPGQLAARLLEQMRPQERRNTQIILGYPPESVGRIMTPEYVSIKPDWTVQQALNHIRHFGKDAEILYTIYVVDDERHLLDEIKLRHLVMADPDSSIRTLMDEQVVSLNAFDDREEAVRAMERYDVPVLPVVDRANVMVGIVTFDDVADVAEEEVTEDFQKASAMAPLETSYREATVWSLVQKRIGWLIILVFMNLVSSGVIAAYEETLAAVIALAFFIPLLIDSGGNTGSQAATLMVRAIATGELRLDQWLRVVMKEISVGIMLGIAMGVASGMLGIFRGGWEIGIVVGVSMVCIVLAANLIGTILPFILTRLRFDPAVASSPLITSIADATGLVIYFTVATMMLGSIHAESNENEPNATTEAASLLMQPVDAIAATSNGQFMLSCKLLIPA